MSKRFQLPKAFAQKWVEALRSGNYKQAKSYLYDPQEKGYCCLGVACKIEGIPEDQLIDEENDPAGVPNGLVIDPIPLPSILLEAASPEPSTSPHFFEEANLVRILTHLNDGTEHKSKTFNEISDWIEANVEFVEELNPENI